MIRRRAFFSFLIRRFSVYVFVTALIAGLFHFVFGIWPVTQLAGLPLLFLVPAFFEYNSIPRGIIFRSGFRLETEDASGAITGEQSFGFRRFLWLTRLVYCQKGKVITIPLEAFAVSRSEVLAQISES